MNITADTIYWISVVDQIKFGLGFAFIFFLALAFGTAYLTYKLWEKWEWVKRRIEEAKRENKDFHDAVNNKDISWIERAKILDEYKEKERRRSWDAPSSEYASSLLRKLRFVSIACGLSFVISISSLVGDWFIPNSRTQAAMLVVPAVFNNGDVKQFPKNALDLADDYLRKVLIGSSKDCSSCNK